MIPAFWHLTSSKWAAAFPRYILDGAISTHHFVTLPPHFSANLNVGVICVPGEDSVSDYERLNEWANKNLEKVLWIIFADEQGLFDVSRLQHPNQVVWAFAPQFPIRKGIDRVAPWGWTTGTQDWIARAQDSRRYTDFNFLGQVTHRRRFECVDAAKRLPNGLIHESKSFSMGLSREDYFQVMVNSKFVLCPGGPCTADSFRFAEALEAGAIPIADDFPGERTWPEGYWEAVCGKNLPFPVVRDWSTLPEILREWKEDYELKRDRCMRWWDAYKRALIERMREDLSE